VIVSIYHSNIYNICRENVENIVEEFGWISPSHTDCEYGFHALLTVYFLRVAKKLRDAGKCPG
jgi:hypothetical protein